MDQLDKIFVLHDLLREGFKVGVSRIGGSEPPMAKAGDDLVLKPLVQILVHEVPYSLVMRT